MFQAGVVTIQTTRAKILFLRTMSLGLATTTATGVFASRVGVSMDHRTAQNLAEYGRTAVVRLLYMCVTPVERRMESNRSQ